MAPRSLLCGRTERLGVVRASDTALLIGNCDSTRHVACAPCGPGSAGQALRNVTLELEQFLLSPAYFGAKYAGLKSGTSLTPADADGKRIYPVSRQYFVC